MPDNIDLSLNQQDKIVKLIITDSKFIESCLRKKLSSEHILSEIAQSLIDLSFDYFKKYFKAPGFDNIIEMICDEVVINKNAKKDNIEAYSFYLNKLDMLGDVSDSVQFLLDNIDNFIKKKIISKLTNSLIKLRDRVDIEPSKQIIIIQEALKDIETKTGKQIIEAMLDENSSDGYETDIVTKFGIPFVDSMLKGGFKVEQYGIILGYTNTGKSWCIAHLAKIATRLGETPLLIDLERSNRKIKLRLKMTFTGMSEDEIMTKGEEVTPIVKKSFVKKSNIILLSDDEKMMEVSSLSSILDMVEEKYKRRPRLILFDSADDLLPPPGKYKNKLEESTAVHIFLKNFAKDNGVCIITTCQAKVEAGKKFWTTHHDTAENINKIRKAQIGISINTSEAEQKLNLHRFYLFKNTDGEVGAKVWARHDYDIGQLITGHGDYERLIYDEMLKNAEV